MNVLVVTPACHFAKTGAAQEDVYAIIRHLQELGHTVALYTIDSPAQSREMLDSICATHGIDVRRFAPDLSDAWKWIGAVFGEFEYFDRSAYVFGQLIQDEVFLRYLDESRPDVIFSFCSYSWPVVELARARGIKSVFRSHNYEPSFFYESIEPLQKLNPVNWLRVLAKRRGERRAVEASGAVASLPFAEVTLYRHWKDPRRVVILTLTFLDTALRPPAVHIGKKPLDIFFLGASYNVPFHARGAKLLIADIAPKVIKQAPGSFRFHICGGKLPAELVKQCDGEQIIYEGYVEHLDAFLDQMDIGAFPVMTGKTIKGKIFHALCRAFPIVIPTIGKGGYDVRNGEEVLIADTAQAFVEAILSLQDETLRRRLVEGAHRFCQMHFTKERIHAVLRDVLGGI